MQKIQTNDGSFTLKSEKYNECYHSSEGAVRESLYKHIYPSFSVIKKKEINILDICFGLGYNTFLSVLNRPKGVKLNLFSPEMDESLVRNLKKFPYPEEFEKIRHIIKKVSKNFYYEDEWIKIELFIGDAREYIKKLKNIDIVYQDAFSPKVNKELWTMEYFTQIKKILNKNGIITTYSVATPVRCALYKLGFKLYTHNTDKIRKGTIASFADLPFKKVDFEEKLRRVDCYYYKDERV
ncbi:tRNA (5-methylaminomethyl-2-thiouridine)(34)-methyltransferase MnmD [Lebetimonas natsushimae]|uniref:tRNA (5-methylaminomethyl-2-thiouridine)(34)-methyltransferase MnmD n=1 Tax=Lebetimonas natsushimae TaxID=1936991 RepID=UPI001EE6EB88|nr:MnmC family methyltransferase [Lebetimonas natsushimae]